VLYAIKGKRQIMQIYLDNGSTTYPKPESVKTWMLRGLIDFQGSAGRSHSGEIHNLERLIYETRVKVAHFFNFDHASHVIFTKNITEGINLVLKGYLKAGDHVLVSHLEHNAVMRPLHDIKGIKYTVIPMNQKGELDLDALESLLKLAPQMIIINHASNVSGDIQDAESIGNLARKYHVPFLLDTAQTAGAIPVDNSLIKADILAFTGHKGLLELAKKIKPFICGGTSSFSDQFEQPTMLPDKFESGTQNTLGILGLYGGLLHIESETIEQIRSIEYSRINRLQAAIEKMAEIRLIGQSNAIKRVGILGIDCILHDNSEVAHRLNKEFGIVTRVGLQCAPAAHQYYGTFPKGTIRFSVSSYTTERDVDVTVSALLEIIKGR
jgi:cysteine desulfurase family protein